MARTGRSDSLSWAHGVGLTHTRLLRSSCAHHARLFLPSCTPLLLQFLLDLVNFFCQEVVVLILVKGGE